MINPTFYTEGRTVQRYLGGKTPHYPVKSRAIVTKFYNYELKYGENMYTLAKDLFGADREYLWTIIADINEVREPDDWSAGETVRLPQIIVNELLEDEDVFINERNKNVKTDSTSISALS